MSEDLEILTQDDVITVEDLDDAYLISQATFRLSDWLKRAEEICTDPEYALYSKGIRCEVLRPGQPWKKGSLKLVFAFCPDDAAPVMGELDQIRQFQMEN